MKTRSTWFQRQEYRVDGEREPRMIKWTLLTLPFCNVFLHRFNGPDWTRDPHDHPSYFVSLGLWGSYVEAVYDDKGNWLHERTWRAPWLRMFPATHVHRTTAVGPRGAWTICVTGRWVHNWGFFLNQQAIGWRDYLRHHRSERSDRPAGAGKGAPS